MLVFLCLYHSMFMCVLKFVYVDVCASKCLNVGCSCMHICVMYEYVYTCMCMRMHMYMPVYDYLCLLHTVSAALMSA